MPKYKNSEGPASTHYSTVYIHTCTVYRSEMGKFDMNIPTVRDLRTTLYTQTCMLVL